ncbi:hypothetical protein [Neptuniibacter sp. QD37_11]|uniref:hypothetical protein n=1 Tax=Neptuniibacter sp. QD37_11 TaxID=3398209 RepID=UPI0039F499C8
MKELSIKLSDDVYTLQKMISSLRDSLRLKEVPISLKEAFDKFDKSIDSYSNAIEGSSDEQVLQAIKMIGVYGQTVAQNLNKVKDLLESQKEEGRNILSHSQQLRSAVEDRSVLLEGKDKTENKNLKTLSIKALNNELNAIKEDHEKHDARIKKLLSENESRVSLFGESTKDIESKVQAKLDEITKLYDDALSTVSSKKEQIEEQLAHATGKNIAGNFDKSAIDERNSANWLRAGSLLCMSLIVAVVAYSFWDTTRANFSWENSIFRLILAFLLSVPAAYLARESAKHREQQYNHLQTSLDLKSITPYLASLPESEQHKLKVDIAKRIFAARDFSKVGSDPYPLNTHEILMEFIKKIEFPKEKQKPDEKPANKQSQPDA